MERLSVPVVVSKISAGKFRRYANLSLWRHLTTWHIVWGNISDSIKIIAGFFQSLWVIMRFQPDVVFTKGGYVCLPVGLAAWILRKPLVIHDSDTRPGLTNRVLARFATVIATGAPLENYSYKPAKSHYTGVPISADFKPVNDSAIASYKKQLGIDSGKTLIVAFGGGLGSVAINDAMATLASRLSSQYVIYNITGKNNINRAVQRGKGLDTYQPVAFVYDGMFPVLAAADIVITRASATALQELAGLKKPVIAVPAHHLGDQRKNAQVFEKAKAVRVLSDADLKDSDHVYSTVTAILNDDKARDSLAQNIHAFAKPHAAEDLAKLIEEAARR